MKKLFLVAVICLSIIGCSRADRKLYGVWEHKVDVSGITVQYTYQLNSDLTGKVTVLTGNSVSYVSGLQFSVSKDGVVRLECPDGTVITLRYRDGSLMNNIGTPYTKVM